MIISIASGKGGTGKTTVATNLALAVDEAVQLLDCDVEEPNAHLFIRPDFEKNETITTPVPQVDTDRCLACLGCINNCPAQAVELAFLGDAVYGLQEFRKRYEIEIALPRELQSL